MKVIITAGGTGGHIYPALAIIDKIKEMEPDSEFIYIGTHNRMEKEIVPKRGIKYIPIEIYGLSTSLKLMGRNIKNLFLINKAYKKCIKIIKDFNPDVVIGVGGYVTFPVIKAAHKCGIKSFIHEQNSIPGKANKSLAKYATRIGVSFKESLSDFNSQKVVMTGNPVSENALKIPKISKTNFNVPKNQKTVLIVNGSLGSQTINNKMIDYLKSINDAKYDVIYVTGKNYYNQFIKNEFPKNVHIEPFVDNLSGLMKDVDLIVSRAGASSVAEIEALGLPCVLIPSPYVANNHQYHNALSIVSSESGEMIEEKDLTKDILRTTIDNIINDEKKIKKYKENLQKLNVSDSATIIYNEIKKML